MTTKTVEKTCVQRFVLVEKPVKEVWKVLTEPEHLTQWLCDQAEVELTPNGKFAFMGKTVVGGGGGQRLLSFRKPKELKIHWPIEGIDTTLNIRLEESSGYTQVTLQHDYPKNAAFSFFDDSHNDRCCIQAINSYLLNLLKSYSELGEVPWRTDFSQQPGESMELSMRVPVSDDKAFAALTDPKKLDEWVATKAKVDLKVGGEYSYGWGDVEPAQIVSLIPRKEISHTWTSAVPSIVKWTIEKKGVGAQITLVHSGFAQNPKTFLQHLLGWSDFMVTLSLYLRKSAPPREWSGRAKN